MEQYVGIDLGGTNIKAGVVNEQGEIISKGSIKTQTGCDQRDIIRDMALLACRVIEEAGLQPDVQHLNRPAA